MIIAIESLVV